MVFGSTAPGTSARPGIGVFLHGGAMPCCGRGLVDVREAHPLHCVEVIEIAPEFLEAMSGRQRVGVIAQMVLAELAGGVAEIEQELGERRRAGPQIGRATRELRRDHAGAQRMHAGEEGIATGRATLLGVVGHEDRAFIADAVDVGRLPDHQAAVIDTRLHPADVIAHDEKNVGLLLLLSRCGCAVGEHADTQNKHNGTDEFMDTHSFYPRLRVSEWVSGEAKQRASKEQERE